MYRTPCCHKNLSWYQVRSRYPWFLVACPKCESKYYEVPPKLGEWLVYLSFLLLLVLLLVVVWLRIKEYHYLILGWMPIMIGAGIFKEIQAYKHGVLVPVTRKLKFYKKVKAFIPAMIILTAIAWEIQNAL